MFREDREVERIERVQFEDFPVLPSHKFSTDTQYQTLFSFCSSCISLFWLLFSRFCFNKRLADVSTRLCAIWLGNKTVNSRSVCKEKNSRGYLDALAVLR